jgi:FkbM family methyltransferase
MNIDRLREQRAEMCRQTPGGGGHHGRSLPFRPVRASTQGQTDQPRVEQAVEIVPIDYGRHRLRIRAESKYERKWRASFSRREPWTVAWLESETRPGDTVYDIGANVGVVSLIGATLLRGEGLVVAFEPSFSSYARLCENIALNGLSSMVVPVPLALSSTSGLQAFTYRSEDPGQSRHAYSAEAWTPAVGNSHKRYTQPMVSVTLDDVVPLVRLPSPNLVKLDVDGAEAHVLRGAQSTLSAPECRSVLVEIDDTHTDDVVSLVESLGFRLDSRHRRKQSSQLWHGAFRRSDM